MLGVKNFGEETIRERLATENIERVVLACIGAIRGSAAHLSEAPLRALRSIVVAASGRRGRCGRGVSERRPGCSRLTQYPHLFERRRADQLQGTALKLWTR